MENKLEKYVNIVYFTILSALLVNTFFGYFDAVISLNNYLALAFCVIAIVHSLLKGRYSTLWLMVLLTLSLFNVINFTIEIFKSGIYFGYAGSQFAGITLNPLMLLLLIAYLLINKKVIGKYYNQFFKANAKEIEEEREKKILFYYNQFVGDSDLSIQNVISKIDTYPIEAQIALKKIKEERKNYLAENGI